MASASVEESSGYDSGSEDSVVTRVTEQPSMSSSFLTSPPSALSTSASLSALGMAMPALPPASVIQRHSASEETRPCHASPDSRPPARLRADHNASSRGAMMTRGKQSPQRPTPRPTLSTTEFLTGHTSSDDLSKTDRDDDVPIQATSLVEYEFPRHRLPIRLRGRIHLSSHQ
jgi:hypothetical protein